MLDVYNLPTRPGIDIQIFTQNITVNNNEWLNWVNPRGLSMANIICIGGGGGGGGGFTGVAASARGGGGGGGGSTVTQLLVPLELLPDRIFLRPGAGGIGTTSGGGAGASGVFSYVSLYADNSFSATNLLLASGSSVPAGGGAGTVGAAGGGGTGGLVSTIANMIFSGLGLFQSIAGQNGAGGGSQTGANGGSQNIPSTGVITMGGMGGAGTTSANFIGGAVAPVGTAFWFDVSPKAPAAGSFAGSGGPTLWKPLFFFAGEGGSSSNAGIGGNGGLGAYGSGGGGGGGGTTGGKGGDGGPGIVIISCW